MRWAGTIAVVAAIAAAPAQAETVAVSGGRAGDVAIALARQTGTSIVIPDRAIAEKSVPAIRGDVSPREAIDRLARSAGARAVAAGPRSWRIVAAPATPRRARATPPRPPAPAPASAPLPEEVPTPDILVVGSKRDARLGEFAGQVSIIDGDQLAFGGLGGTEKIVQRTPTVTSTYLGSGRNKLFIRGIADSSFTGPTQSTVGQYLGDLRLSYNAPDPDLRLADLARVEILEGPQGTLYGAGSLGGIVRLVPNDPQTGVVAASGMVGASATQHGSIGGDASLTANLPLLGDLAALRVTLNAETQGGYIDKPALGRSDVNRTDIFGARAAARFELANGWTVDLIGVGQSTDGHDSQYADRDGPPLTRAAAVPEGHEATYWQGQLVVTGWLGALRFKSSTGVTAQDLEERYDATVRDGPARLFVQANDTDMVANETRVWQPLEGRFGWLAGLSFTHNRTRLTRTLGQPLQPSAVAGVTNVIDEFTAFAEGTLRIADGLTATAGGRLTHSRLGGAPEGPPLVFPPFQPPAPAGDLPFTVSASELRAITMSRTEQVFLPSASLSAAVLPRTTLYLRYQEGFRPGGLAIAGFGLNRFRNDRIATFELGARTRGPVELTASLSHTRWNDIQADFIDSTGLPSTANIGDGRIWSGTLTLAADVTDTLRIDAGVTYNDSRIDQPSQVLLRSAAEILGVPAFIGRFQDLPATVLERITRVPNVADLSGRIGFDYRRRLENDLDLTAQGWATYVGSSRLGIGPELGEEQGDYLDSGLTVRLGHETFGVTLGLTNLTDEEGNRFALGTPFAIGRSQITPLRPRTLRLGIDAAF